MADTQESIAISRRALEATNESVRISREALKAKERPEESARVMTISGARCYPLALRSMRGTCTVCQRPPAPSECRARSSPLLSPSRS